MYQHNSTSFSSVETWPNCVEILCWNLCFENKQWGGIGGLRLPLFHCRVIMMIKSQLQSYSKQWYAHSWGDSQSAGFAGSLFTVSHFWSQWGTGSLCQTTEMGNIAFSGEKKKGNHSNTKHKFNGKTLSASIAGKMLLPVPTLTVFESVNRLRENTKLFHEPVLLLMGITLVYVLHSKKLFKGSLCCSIFFSFQRVQREVHTR